MRDDDDVCFYGGWQTTNEVTLLLTYAQQYQPVLVVSMLLSRATKKDDVCNYFYCRTYSQSVGDETISCVVTSWQEIS